MPNLMPTASRNITATAGGAAFFNTDAAIITTASLTTAVTATASFTLSSPSISGPPSGNQSIVIVTVGNGTNSAGTPDLASTTVTNGQVVVVVQNIAAAGSFNGTLILSVLVFN